MRLAMSFKTRRELLVQLMPRYREAARKQKKFLLDEFVLSTGYSRKYAIRLLGLKNISKVEKISRLRPRYYGSEEQEIIKLAWSAANFISSKRLAPFLKELIPTLERHGYLIVSDEVREKVISISASTIDRILNSYRKSLNPQGISTTKSGILLKKQITVRTFADWEETSPGFFEADLVAHCGTTTEGSYLSTLVLTDILTGWTECLPLLFHNQDSVAAALDIAMILIPFPILGLDTDNGTEFINQTIIDYCENHDITFALWKHAVIERRENKLPNSKDCVSFIPNSCLLTENKTIQSLPNNFTKDALELEKRKYRLTRKPRVPHTWRTRKDPFEKVWDDICLQLENEPERTAKSLFDDLLWYVTRENFRMDNLEHSNEESKHGVLKHY